MNRLFTEKNRKLFYFELAIIIFLLILVVFLGLSRTRVQKQTSAIKKQNIELNQKIQAKQVKLNKEASDKALSDADREVKISALQVQSEKSAKKLINKLFPILLTYSDSKSYLKRKNLAEPYLSESVLHSKNIFATSDTDMDQLDEIGLHSKFKSVGCSMGIIKDNHIPMTILTSYESWESGLRHGVGQDIYEASYNISTGKLDHLERINNLYSGRANDDDDDTND